MVETFTLNSLEQLKPFLNDDNVLEVVTRDKRKKFKKFFRFILDGDSMNEMAVNAQMLNDNQQLTQKVLQAIGKNISVSQKNLQLLENVAKMQGVGLVLNGLNLGATCVGFAIMNKKLNNISAQLNHIMEQLKKAENDSYDILTEHEFNHILGQHSDMLDCRRKQKPYSEEKMRELVDQEYNALTLLINIFQKEKVSEKQTLFTMIFSLVSMFTVSLKYFDEIYYENNHEVLQDVDVFHTSHTKWMGIFDKLSTDRFKEEIQDYGMFELNLNTRETDIFYKEMMAIVLDGKQEIEDNLFILNKMKDMKFVYMFREYTEYTAREELDGILDETKTGYDAQKLKIFYSKIIDQAMAA